MLLERDGGLRTAGGRPQRPRSVRSDQVRPIMPRAAGVTGRTGAPSPKRLASMAASGGESAMPQAILVVTEGEV